MIRKWPSESCTEHIWAKVIKEGFRTPLGIVYLWAGNNCEEENQRVLQCISSGITDQGGNHEVEDLDECTDTTGSMLLDLTEEHDLVLVNMED